MGGEWSSIKLDLGEFSKVIIPAKIPGDTSSHSGLRRGSKGEKGRSRRCLSQAPQPSAVPQGPPEDLRADYPFERKGGKTCLLPIFGAGLSTQKPGKGGPLVLVLGPALPTLAF